MKVLILLTIGILVTGCETVKQAKTDYENFKGTLILFNSGMPYQPYKIDEI